MTSLPRLGVSDEICPTQRQQCVDTSFFFGTTMFRPLIFCLVVCLSIGITSSQPVSRGWGDDIEWRTFEEGVEVSALEGKWMMIIAQNSEDEAWAQELKDEFRSSHEVTELSKQFVMVNALNSELPPSIDYTLNQVRDKTFSLLFKFKFV